MRATELKITRTLSRVCSSITGTSNYGRRLGPGAPFMRSREHAHGWGKPITA